MLKKDKYLEQFSSDPTLNYLFKIKLRRGVMVWIIKSVWTNISA